MPAFADQIAATQAAHMAARALSDAAVSSVRDIIDQLSAGNSSIETVRSDIRSVVTYAYRESASTARQLTMNLPKLSGWIADNPLTDSPYLQSLLRDVERNLNEFKRADHDEKAVRRLKFRLELSAQAAAARGFTDGQTKHYEELQALGYKLRKVWFANFINNEPCADCVNLHGTEVDFKDEFPVPTLSRTAVYRDLQGPPLHPRCKCHMVVLIVSATNMFDKVPRTPNTAPSTMSTETVKNLPKRVFDTIIRVLRAIIGGRRRD